MINGVIMWLCMLAVMKGRGGEGRRSGVELEQGKVVVDRKMDSSGSCLLPCNLEVGMFL